MTATQAAPYPRLVAFDLDATLWLPEMYMLSGPPFRVDPDDPQCVLDRGGEQVELMGSSREILAELATQPQWQDTEVAYVSRTEYPQWANACLKLFKVCGAHTMHSMASIREIYVGSKVTHFKRIQAATGIAFKDMLFFDNESWNIKVGEGGGLDRFLQEGGELRDGVAHRLHPQITWAACARISCWRGPQIFASGGRHPPTPACIGVLAGFDNMLNTPLPHRINQLVRLCMISEITMHSWLPRCPLLMTCSPPLLRRFRDLGWSQYTPPMG
ncbi:hypothetical protein ACKKBG_A02770 [Auxenochlorella protothecoides x Auxenochlorella symbiontica]